MFFLLSVALASDPCPYDLDTFISDLATVEDATRNGMTDARANERMALGLECLEDDPPWMIVERGYRSLLDALAISDPHAIPAAQARMEASRWQYRWPETPDGCAYDADPALLTRDRAALEQLANVAAPEAHDQARHVAAGLRCKQEPLPQAEADDAYRAIARALRPHDRKDARYWAGLVGQEPAGHRSLRSPGPNDPLILACPPPRYMRARRVAMTTGALAVVAGGVLVGVGATGERSPAMVGGGAAAMVLGAGTATYGVFMGAGPGLTWTGRW
ncbi:MAG: hypothetical protein EP330_17810 [Deltaproteobacteria bacterium]|nr:MAG: hypothetical protein EP330_17810 [Deltaproteobacteria bacterium]